MRKQPLGGLPRPSPLRYRPPTIVDVARLAGVSKSLVSRALRGEPAVSEASRLAVQAAAARLGYRPNAAARNLVQQRSYTAGVLVTDLHNVFYAEVLDGIEEAASENGYRMLITTGHRDAGLEIRALETLLEMRVDCVIVAGIRIGIQGLAAAAREVVLVTVARALDLPGVAVVVNDDRRGGELAFNHLADLGHIHIAHIDGGTGPGAAERRQGFEAAAARRGLGDQIQVIPGDFTEEGGYTGTRRLLSSRRPPTAIFAANDLCALGVLNALGEAGLRAPDDVSVIGYDNISPSALRHPSLTTINQPRQRMGRMAMESALRRLHRPDLPAPTVMLPPELVVRASTGPPRFRPRR